MDNNIINIVFFANVAARISGKAGIKVGGARKFLLFGYRHFRFFGWLPQVEIVVVYVARMINQLVYPNIKPVFFRFG